MFNKKNIVSFIAGAGISALVSLNWPTENLPSSNQSNNATTVQTIEQQTHPSDRLVHNWTSLFTTPLSYLEAEWVEEVPVYNHAKQIVANETLFNKVVQSFFSLDDTPARRFLLRIVLALPSNLQETAMQQWLTSSRQLDIETAITLVMYMEDQPKRLQLIIKLIENKQFNTKIQQHLFAHLRRDRDLINAAVLNPYVTTFIQSAKEPILRAYALKTLNPEPEVAAELFAQIIAFTESNNELLCFEGMNVLNEWSLNFPHVFSKEQHLAMQDAANKVIANSNLGVSIRYKGLEWLENIP